MPKVTASFFNVLIWRSVRAILICFMAPVTYTPDTPPVNPPRIFLTKLAIRCSSFGDVHDLILPIGAVEPTPFQRDLSDAHHKSLADVINKTGRFLDPIIAVVAPRNGFWTPNGRHRLEAMRRLGAKSIAALVVADRDVAWQILVLNTEKAHNLKERALEVIRIYRGLIDEDASRPESQFAFYLDEAALVTLGICYERAPRFGGGAYHPILRRLESFTDEPLRAAI